MEQDYDVSEIIALEEFPFRGMRDVVNFLDKLGPDITKKLIAHKSELDSPTESKEGVTGVNTLSSLEDYLIQAGVEPHLIEKGMRWLKKDEIFRKSSHQWRRNRNEAEKGHPNYRSNKPYKEFGYGYHRPAPNQHTEIKTQLYLGESLQITREGTNQILEHYFGIPEGPERNAFLRTWNENPHYGAELLRGAVQITKPHGLDTYTKIQAQEVLLATMKCLHEGCRDCNNLQKGKQLTELVAGYFGILYMPELIRGYVPFRKFNSLVPRRDVPNIASAMKELHKKGPALMHYLGYESVKIGHIPILWYRPAMVNIGSK